MKKIKEISSCPWIEGIIPVGIKNNNINMEKIKFISTEDLDNGLTEYSLLDESKKTITSFLD